MTKVYAFNCEALCNDAAWPHVLSLLDATRQIRVGRLQTPQKKAQCAAAGLLLRHLFGADETVVYRGNGKPYLSSNPDTHFSLSHTGTWVFCAVADSPVGIDAQVQATYNERLAARWFNAEERQWMQADPDARFTRLWTQKEAYAKMTGDGMAKTTTGGFTIPHSVKEYPDLVVEGIYVTACVAGVEAFAPGIEIVKEPLW